MTLKKIVEPLLLWYDRSARILPWRSNPEPYAVWISEIMLQQTRVEAAKPYFDRWMKAFPDLSTLADASESEVLKLWEGLGYYSRVRNIHKTAKLIMEKHGGSIPPSFDALRGLPGIGEYTAGAVGSIAFGLPVPCVDGNVLRVVARITAEETDITSSQTKKLITGKIQEIIPKDRPGDFNQAMMELGATVCLPNGAPRCETCPVAFLCEARIQDRIAEFPVKSGKPTRKAEQKTILIVLSQRKADRDTEFIAALRKRPSTGLLAGLWEFPNYEGALTADEAASLLKAQGLEIAHLVKLKKAKHIFSHIEWDMAGYLILVKDQPVQALRLHSDRTLVAENGASYETFLWAGTDDLEKSLTLPAAFKTYYQIMKNYIEEESKRPDRSDRAEGDRENE